ncbi:acetyl-CoA carboxylase carboxyltransferase subunit alpha [Hungatella effluvii]|uniref:Multifunctional fusion protein n=1 Tax=Hungatella effluvii TaxID=1096246 RepID=A0A2V3Y3X9_9FIRM|nr:acetyl-CoA carboxylase carboxyltransferase subunit alpha [Hungatella effluvii]PXX52351.1 acetyl-CoA carboxylase carboxyltransferase subunit alpha [Hungatella effluvii]
MLKDMFKKTYTLIDSKYKTPDKADEPNIPAGLWRKCNKCGQPIYAEDVRNNFYICPKCKGYFRVHAYRRIEMTADAGSFEEWDKEMEFANPLDFPGYEKKIEAAREKTKLNEAIVTGKCTIGGEPAVLGVCDARFIMSSMGHVVGEKIARAVERATKEQLPVIIFACSGGARMQEGIVSLMQMAKTSAALKRHHNAGQLFVSVLTDPTTGGVTASFAMLGDIILAEPGALIGFAGPRVIEQTIGQKLPEGFQRSEFLQDHGFVDKIVKREDMKSTISAILKLHHPHKQEDNGENTSFLVDNCSQPAGLSGKEKKTKNRRNKKSPWDTVQLSRSAERPVASDYINAVFDDFMEFHGDRYFGDDGAVVGGLAFFHGMPVTVIGQEKGKNTKDNIKRNFGMPSPEGYRKALRLMKQAETFGRPVICFVDTPGAFCGLEAEERGQGEAIARNLFEMADITVPMLSIVIGEGGSGGALAMAVANEVWMLENAIYSILSPEGFASILYKDSKKASDAARVMKITARDLMELGLIERIIAEEEPASAENLTDLAKEMDSAMEAFFAKYAAMPKEEIASGRYDRFRRM